MTEHALARLHVPAAIFKEGPLTTREGYTLSAADQLTLMQMPARFEWAFGSQNAPALMAMLTDDIQMDHALGNANGKDEVGLLSIPSYGLRHQFLNHVVYIDEDGDAAMLSYMHVSQVVEERPTGTSMPALFVHLVLRDKFRKVDGRWRFSRRIFDQLKFGDYVADSADQQTRMAETAEERHARLTVS